jgi:hypothetical protein
MTIDTLVVSYTAQDEALWLEMRPKLEAGLAAHRNPLMKKLKIWTFRDLRGGQNDHNEIQEQFQSPTSAGLLCVSVAACGRPYIQTEEWPLFRNTAGTVLKPFVAVLLSPIDRTQVDLGVLDRIDHNATQLLHVAEGGMVCTWQDCLNHFNRHGDASLREKFISALIRDLEIQLYPSPKS